MISNLFNKLFCNKTDNKIKSEKFNLSMPSRTGNGRVNIDESTFLKLLHDIPNRVYFGQPLAANRIVIHCDASDIPLAIKTITEECNSKIIGVHIHNDDTKGQYDLAGHKLIATQDLARLVYAKIICFTTQDSTVMFHHMINRLNVKGCIGNMIIYSSPSVPKSPYRMLPANYLNRNINYLIYVFNLLEDDESRMCYLRFLKARLTGDIGYLLRTSFEHYFHKDVPVLPGEHVLDVGVSDDIRFTRIFSRNVGLHGKVYAFEPEQHCLTAAKEQLNTPADKNIELFDVGLWNKDETLYITNRGQDSVVTSENTDSTSACKLVAFDSFIQKTNIEHIDIIKLDIEGAEISALKGMKNTIKKFHPKLMICLYHLPEDPYAIPLLINELGLEYKYYVAQSMWRSTGCALFAAPVK